MTFKNNYTDYDNNLVISKKTVYNAETLKQIVDDIQDKINAYTKQVVVKGNTIAALSGYRTNELEDFLQRNEITSKTKIEQIEKDIARYTRHKSNLSSIKGKTFKAQNFEYDKKNGRIIKMIFVQS